MENGEKCQLRASSESALERCGKSDSKNCRTDEPQSRENLRQLVPRRPTRAPHSTSRSAKAMLYLHARAYT